jgi:hypothetical protein
MVAPCTAENRATWLVTVAEAGKRVSRGAGGSLVPGAQGTSTAPPLNMSALSDKPPTGRIALPPNDHLVVTGTLHAAGRAIPMRALIDSGATGVAFVDAAFERLHKLPMRELHPRQELEVVDGRPIASGPITQCAMAELTIAGHRESIDMYVTSLGHYPLVLGLPWLRKHDVTIRFATNTVSFDSQLCREQCLRTPVDVTPHKGRKNAHPCPATSPRALGISSTYPGAN